MNNYQKENETVWRFLTFHRAMDLLIHKQFHCTRTKYMNDYKEGFSIKEQILNVRDNDFDQNEYDFDDDDFYDEDKNNYQNEIAEDFNSILKWLNENKTTLTLYFEALNTTGDANYAPSSYKILELAIESISDLQTNKDKLLKKYKSSYVDATTLNTLIKNIQCIIDKLNTFYTSYEIEEIDHEIKENTYLSCWNLSEEMNMVLWEAYSKEQFGIAIKTTKTKLINSLQNWHKTTNLNAITSKVIYENNPTFLYEKYLDCEGNEFSTFNFLSPHLKKLDNIALKSLTHKKKSYSSENEFRTIIYDPNNIDGNIFIPIDDNFIEEIHINPLLTNYNDHVKLLKTVLKLSNFNKTKIMYKEQELI